MVAIFDMDGVIADTNPFHRQTWGEYARRRFNHELTEDEFITYVSGRTNDDIITYLLQGGALSRAEMNQLGYDKEALFREVYAPHAQPVPGLVPFLQEIRANGVRTAVATSAPVENLTFIINALDLRPYFDLLLDISQVTYPKPNPEIYQKAIAGLVGTPSKAVVFEDSRPGIQAGRGAGANVVGLATTHSVEELTSEVDLVIRDFTEIDFARLNRLVAGRSY